MKLSKIMILILYTTQYNNILEFNITSEAEWALRAGGGGGLQKMN